ncbi:RDD family protein, partial [Intrasporangium sp.]|uniref:RDD family protein n=1 Tax=Intrasporangium sp. TaxID=1925024 RepID=UPI0032218921
SPCRAGTLAVSHADHHRLTRGFGSDSVGLGERVVAAALTSAAGALVSGPLVAAALAGGAWRRGSGRAGAAVVADAVVTVVPWLVVGVLDDAGLAGSLGGKSRSRLRIVDRSGDPATAGRLILREAVKLAPWQLAHLGVRQQVGRLGGDRCDQLGRLALGGSLVLAAVSVASVLITGRALHDWVSGTNVRRDVERDGPLEVLEGQHGKEDHHDDAEPGERLEHSHSFHAPGDSGRSPVVRTPTPTFVR